MIKQALDKSIRLLIEEKLKLYEKHGLLTHPYDIEVEKSDNDSYKVRVIEKIDSIKFDITVKGYE